MLIQSTGDTINNELDPTRIDVSTLDSRIKAEHVSRTPDHKELCLHPYILPYV